MGGGLVL